MEDEAATAFVRTSRWCTRHTEATLQECFASICAEAGQSRDAVYAQACWGDLLALVRASEEECQAAGFSSPERWEFARRALHNGGAFAECHPWLMARQLVEALVAVPHLPEPFLGSLLWLPGFPASRWEAILTHPSCSEEIEAGLQYQLLRGAPGFARARLRTFRARLGPATPSWWREVELALELEEIEDDPHERLRLAGELLA